MVVKKEPVHSHSMSPGPITSASNGLNSRCSDSGDTEKFTSVSLLYQLLPIY